MSVRHLLWDFDGTLFDTYPAFIRAFMSALAEFGYAGDPHKIDQLTHISISTCAAELAGEFDLAQEAMEAAFGRHYSEIPYDQQLPMPGAYEVCQRVQGRGGMNLLVTHRRRVTTLGLLEAHTMRSFFSDMICAEDGYPNKPDPSSFLAILVRNELEPQETLAIGDRSLDVQAGQQAGIGTCLLGNTAPGVTPDYRVDWLDQLLDIL